MPTILNLQVMLDFPGNTSSTSCLLFQIKFNAHCFMLHKDHMELCLARELILNLLALENTFD